MLLVQNSIAYLTGFLGALGVETSMKDLEVPGNGSAADAITSQGSGKIMTPTQYSVVQGYYDLLSDSFGLIEKGPKRWHDLRSKVDRLNSDADEHTTYKVIYLARHGQGFHNVAETKYGTPAWNDYWSRLYTDGEITWGPDPLLTPLGIQQAQNVNAAWKIQIAEGAPSPRSLYCSPLTRAAKTLEITWADILLDKGYRPLIVEKLRETIGLHTCDKRSDKSIIAKRFPEYDIEAGFSEHDQLWSTDYQESSRQQTLRLQQQLNLLFATDPSTFISITAHGGVINAIFKVLGHPDVSVLPGGFIPIVVKAVDYPHLTSESFAGGQSVSAPPLPSTPTPKPTSS